MRKINAHCVRVCVCIWRSLWLLYTHIYVFTNTLKYLHHIFSHLAGFLVSVFWFLVSGFWFCGLHCALNWNVLNKPIKIKITVALCHAPTCSLPLPSATDARLLIGGNTGRQAVEFYIENYSKIIWKLHRAPQQQLVQLVIICELLQCW